MKTRLVRVDGVNRRIREEFIGERLTALLDSSALDAAEIGERNALLRQAVDRQNGKPATCAEAAQPDHIEQFFAWSHLPPHLQAVSRPFGELAQRIVDTVPRNPERTVALRKLLEAKDAAVRAVVAK